MTIDKQALRQLATDAHELGIIKRYSKGLEAQRKFYAAATPLVIRVLLDELEAAEKRKADQRGIILSARKFISDYAGLGDVGAAEFIKIIDRATGTGKGE